MSQPPSARSRTSTDTGPSSADVDPAFSDGGEPDGRQPEPGEPAMLDDPDVWDPLAVRVTPPADGMWSELSQSQLHLRDRAREIAETELRPHAREWDENESFPRRSLEVLRDAGLLGVTVPERYGGGGLGILEGCLIVEELARGCVSSAMVAQPFLNGPWRAIHVLGTDDQRERYLPGVAAGTRHFAIAMSEPGAGSSGTDLTAELRDGRGGLTLHGTKSWVTGGREADTTIVFCRAPGTTGPYGIGAVLVGRDTPGATPPEPEPKMGFRGVAEVTLRFDGTPIDPADVLVEPDPASKRGAEVLVQQFNPERCGNAAMCTGIAQVALDDTLAYVEARRQFGRELVSFQGVQWKLADMALQIEIARMLTWRAARSAGSSFPRQHDTVMAKLYASEMVQRVTNEAIQLHGARGYSRRWPLERYFRDGRGLAMGGGTAEIMRNILAGIVTGRRFSQRGETA